MHDNFSIYFSICNLLQQLVVSFQTSYREDINDDHFPSSVPILCNILLNISMLYLNTVLLFASAWCFGCKQ